MYIYIYTHTHIYIYTHIHIYIRRIFLRRAPSTELVARKGPFERFLRQTPTTELAARNESAPLNEILVNIFVHKPFTGCSA